MADIFTELRSDHDLQRGLVRQLLETHGDEPDRKRIFLALQAQLEAHATAEERHLYTVMLTDDDTQDRARHSIAEHKELDDLIERLETYDRTAPQWLLTARDLAERLLHHLDEEEQEVFPLAGRSMDDEAEADAGLGYRAEMDELLG